MPTIDTLNSVAEVMQQAAESAAEDLNIPVNRLFGAIEASCAAIQHAGDAQRAQAWEDWARANPKAAAYLTRDLW